VRKENKTKNVIAEGATEGFILINKHFYFAKSGSFFREGKEKKARNGDVAG
jgi:hypothetical protein